MRVNSLRYVYTGGRNVIRAVWTALPGVAILVSGAVVAHAVSPIIGVNSLLLAIVLGFVLANTLGIPRVAAWGIATHPYWLVSGIVLMGVSLTLDSVFELGATVLFIVVAVAGFTLVAVELFARFLSVGERLSSLLAAGASICGVSAVIGVSRAIRATQAQVAYAAATILLFDAITLVVYPVIGNVLGLSSVVFGVWAGVSMFSTGPVVAVGFAHSDLAGQWATITKLARNTLIGLVVVVYASHYARAADEPSTSSVRTLWESFPKFVFGFLLFMVLASVGAFTTSQQAAIEMTYEWLFLIAFVGLGTDIRLAALRRAGLKPAIAVLCALLIVSTFSLGLLIIIFS